MSNQEEQEEKQESGAREHGLAIHGFGALSPNPWIGGGALPEMRPVPPPSAAEIRDFPWKRDPSLIHARLIH
eukprot:1789516-Pyramimonas_sp.AAC.1